MRKYVTVLIGYEENESIPAFAPGMKALGGEVYAVLFDDIFSRLVDIGLIEPGELEEMGQFISASVVRH